VPLYTQDGNRLSLSEFNGLTTSATTTVYTLTTDVYETYTYDSEDAGADFATPDGYRLKYPSGTQLTTAQRDALYQNATIASVTPATGTTAGGTTIVIVGTNFTMGSTAAVGGTACTSPVVTSPTRMTAITPAKTAGAYAVTVTTDTNTASKANAFTTS
jgi:IPT/TIG domain